MGVYFLFPFLSARLRIDSETTPLAKYGNGGDDLKWKCSYAACYEVYLHPAFSPASQFDVLLNSVSPTIGYLLTD